MAPEGIGATTFGLDVDPLGRRGILNVDDRPYEFVVIARSGHAFPSGVENHALVPGLEPLDVELADRPGCRSSLGWSKARGPAG